MPCQGQGNGLETHQGNSPVNLNYVTRSHKYTRERSCTPNNTSKAKESICMYIKQLYLDIVKQVEHRTLLLMNAASN